MKRMLSRHTRCLGCYTRKQNEKKGCEAIHETARNDTKADETAPLFVSLRVA